MQVDAFVVDEACERERVPVCVRPGRGIGRAAFHRHVGTRDLVLPQGIDCISVDPDWTWQSCGGDDDPPGCDCFCREDYCPGEEDVRALEECRVEMPCALLNLSVDDPTCVMTALRDRVPGFYEVWSTPPFGTQSMRMYVGSSGEAQAVWSTTGDTPGTCPPGTSWGGAHRGELEAPEYFETCLTGTDPSCRSDTTRWFSTKQAATPECE